MFSLKGMNRWIAPPLAALIMAGSVIPAVFAATSAVPLAVLSCEKTLGRPAHKPPPPGQLKRRGVVGEIIGVDADAGTIMIGTKFGGVEIEVPKDFVVSDDLLGSRTAVLTAKELKDIDDESDGVLDEDVSTDEGTFVDDTGEGATDEGTSADDTGEAATDEGTSADGTDEAATDEGTSGDGTGEAATDEGASGDGTGEGATDEGTSDDPIRTASALKITIIPTVSTITHEQAVVVATTEGSVEVIDEDGEVGDVDITDSGDATGEEGLTTAPPREMMGSLRKRPATGRRQSPVRQMRTRVTGTRRAKMGPVPSKRETTSSFSPSVRTWVPPLSPNPPKDTDGRREGSGRGWVRELQGRWPGLLG